MPPDTYQPPHVPSFNNVPAPKSPVMDSDKIPLPDLEGDDDDIPQIIVPIQDSMSLIKTMMMMMT